MLSQNNNTPVISSEGSSLALKKLILQAKNGDTEAFGIIYKELYTPLYRYTISRCKNKDLALDITQQTFLKFYEALSSYEPQTSPLAYLFTISKRLLINHGEKKTFESFDDTLLETYEDESVSILDEVHIQELSQSIMEYLDRLSKDEQEVIRLYFLSELSYKEISDIMEKEESYLRKIKERALKKLRILTKHLYE
ncbi:MAG: polymerase sigma factor SigR [Candidatus Parcubacteria bacterium]|jgi:RNA polymerase sigma-70 factor (ECF subfamily)